MLSFRRSSPQRDAVKIAVSYIGCALEKTTPSSNREPTVPQFLIERNFAEQLEVSREAASTIKQVNDELSLRWVFSFLSADKKKTYCLYEAPSAEAIREAARRLNIPADKIIELGGQLRPEMFA